MPDRILPHHVTAPLLDRVVDQALDQEYAEVAARRGPAGGPRRRSPHTLAAATMALIGLTGGVAFALNTRDRPADETSRAVLISQIQDLKSQADSEQQQINDLQSESVRLQSRVTGLDDDLSQLQARNDRLGLLSGFTPASGPGVQIVVDDAPSGLPEGIVRDEDLALLVDGLWGAGAEAIAINGKRLSALSGIRNSALAINVSSRPLSPPYVVEAIGDPNTLQSRLLASSRGNDFFGVAEQLGFEVQMSNQTRLRLPAARQRPLRNAVAVLGPAHDRVQEGGAP